MQPKKKKVIRLAAGSRRQAGHPRNVPASTTHSEEVIILDDGDSDMESEDEAVREEAAVSEDAAEGDSGQVIHDDLVVKTLWGRAIQIMKDKGIVIEKEEEKMALLLFPHVSLVLYNEI